MEELIKKVLKELNIEECFLENRRAYAILKFYYRTKLTDIYKYHVYVNEKEKVKCDKNEIKSEMEKENYSWKTMRDFISVDDIEMLKFMNSKIQDKKQWNEIIEHVKLNNPILSVDLENQVKDKQMVITYIRDKKKEKTYMYYDRLTDSVDILSVQEDVIQEKNQNKKLNKKSSNEMDFIEYEMIRLNINTGKNKGKERKKEIKEEKEYKKTKMASENQKETIEPIEEKKENIRKTYQIMYEKVNKNGEIAYIDLRTFNGDLDLEKVNKIVNKLEKKYNRDILRQMSETISENAKTIRDLFEKNIKRKNGSER